MNRISPEATCYTYDDIEIYIVERSDASMLNAIVCDGYYMPVDDVEKFARKWGMLMFYYE